MTDAATSEPSSRTDARKAFGLATGSPSSFLTMKLTQQQIEFRARRLYKQQIEFRARRIYNIGRRSILGAGVGKRPRPFSELPEYAKDAWRAIAAALDALEWFELDAIIATASPKELRSLRIAFQAGAGWAERRAHRERSESGRKSLKETIATKAVAKRRERVLKQEKAEATKRR